MTVYYLNERVGVKICKIEINIHHRNTESALVQANINIQLKLIQYKWIHVFWTLVCNVTESLLHT